MANFGSASVNVVADTRGFQRDLERELARIPPAQVPVTPDMRPFNRALDRRLRRLEAEIAVSANVDRLTRDIDRALNRARFQVQVDAVLNDLPNQQITVNATVDEAVFRASVLDALRGIEPVRIRVEPDMSGFDGEIRRHNTPSVNVPVDADTDPFERALSRLTSSAARAGGTLTRVLGIALIGAQAASAIGAVAGLASELGSLAGITAAIPAAVTGVAISMGVLRAALLGVGEAFEAALTGTSEEFTEAIENLSPAAQQAAQSLRDLRDPITELQQSLQQSFFKPLVDDFERLENVVGGTLNASLSALAGNFGRAASGVAGFITSAQGIARLQTVIDALGTATSGLEFPLRQAASGFLDVAAAVSEAFGERLNTAILDAVNDFATFLQSAASSGDAVSWVEGAIAAFQQLGDIMSNVGRIFSSIGAATGGGFLALLEDLTGRIADFFASAEGSQALTDIFSTLAALGSAVAPVFQSLISVVGSLLTTLQPVFEILGRALTSFIEAIGPAIEPIASALVPLAGALATAFEALEPALAPVGEAIAAIVEALAPLLPVIATIIASIAGALAPVFTALAEAIAPIVENLAGPLTEFFTRMGEVLGDALLIALEAVAPLFPVIADALGRLLEALAPLIPMLIEALLPALEPIAEAFTAVLEALLPIIPSIVQLVEALAPLLETLAPIIGLIAQFAAQILSWGIIEIIVPLIELIVGALTGLIDILTTVVTAVGDFVNMVVGWFQDLYNILVGNSIIPDLINAIINWFSQLPGRVVAFVRDLVNQVIQWFSQLPGRVVAALSSLGSSIAGVFRNAWNFVRDGVSSLFNNIVNFFRDLPDRVIAAIGDIGARIRDFIRGQVGDIGGFVEGLIPFAEGGIVVGPTKALIGEAGPEVVIPLSKPQRAMELMQQAGLIKMMGRMNAGPSGPQVGQQHTWNITTNQSDPQVVAQRMYRQMIMASGV